MQAFSITRPACSLRRQASGCKQLVPNTILSKTASYVMRSMVAGLISKKAGGDTMGEAFYRPKGCSQEGLDKLKRASSLLWDFKLRIGYRGHQQGGCGKKTSSNRIWGFRTC